MHSPCIRVDSLLSVREYTAPIHSTSSHPNTSLLRARWTPARVLRQSHIGRQIPGAHLLTQAVRGATSTRSACTLRVERPRRTVVHFFPHPRPPDTHSHLSQWSGMLMDGGRWTWGRGVAGGGGRARVGAHLKKGARTLSRSLCLSVPVPLSLSLSVSSLARSLSGHVCVRAHA